MTFIITFCAISLFVFLVVVWPICVIAARTDQETEERFEKWERQNRIDAAKGR